jgi:hypothetical protein
MQRLNPAKGPPISDDGGCVCAFGGMMTVVTNDILLDLFSIRAVAPSRDHAIMR